MIRVDGCAGWRHEPAQKPEGERGMGEKVGAVSSHKQLLEPVNKHFSGLCWAQ